MALLTADMLQKTQSFVGKPVKKDIAWEFGGKKHKAHVFVKLSSYETAMDEFKIYHEGNTNMMVARIVSSIVDEKGNPIFKLENIVGDEDGAGKMCSSLFMALVGAVNEANGFVDTNNEELEGKN